MKKYTAFLSLLLSIGLFVGCAAPAGGQKRQVTYLTLFDTVTTVVGITETEEEFSVAVQAIHDELLVYHQLFDIYHDYEGLANLKTVNDAAGIAPVTVDTRIIDLLQDCKRYYEVTNGRVNVAMGGVLALWHEARTAGVDNPDKAYLPEETALREAAAHTSLAAVVIDEAASTVFITDPLVQLDVGAVAKGWAVERVARTAPEGLLISVGGNVRATGSKDQRGTPWVVGVQNPDNAEQYLNAIYVYAERGSVVTSGDYQRAYTVDGVRYHHIIDPDTLYPAHYWRSVTIVCADSGAADALSTALFLLPQEEGRALLEAFDAEAMWVDAEGTIFYSDGFQDLIRT